MNVLEQMAQMANKGELAEPIRAVDYANNVEIMTENYTKTGPDRGEEGINPPVVDADTIREAMAKGYRQKANYTATPDPEMPYFTDSENINSEGTSDSNNN